MCGLVGMVGTLGYRHKEVMKELLFLNTLRGKDSTGLTTVSRDRGVRTRKNALPGYEFIELKTVDAIMQLDDQLWIGHNRFKTHGSISKENAHPFEIIDDDGDVLLVGAHNGTLENKYAIEQRVGDKFETDSEAFFHLLTAAPNTREAIKMLRGAWSFVWWDPTTDSVHFCRNDQRPMTYAFTKDRKVMIWASEPWMLVNACRRNGVELASNEKGLSCFSTTPDNLYTMKIPQEKDKELPELTREGGYSGAPKGYFQEKRYGVHNHWTPWWDHYEDDEFKEKKEAGKTGKKETTSSDEKTKEGNVITLGLPPHRKRGYKGQEISAEELKSIMAKGCSWCKDEVKEGSGFAFLDENNVVCRLCIDDKHPKDGDRVHQDSPEYRRLIDAAATGAAAKAVG
jgi:asparagine synthetase B (glutamine-hydrolysing)